VKIEHQIGQFQVFEWSDHCVQDGPGMNKLVALTLVGSALVTSVAHADTGEDGPKSPDTALMLSLGGTATSAVLFLGGASSNDGGLMMAGLATSLVTPSLGEWYAGKGLTTGMGIRAVSAAAELAGIAEAFSCIDAEDTCSNNNGAAGVLIFGGLIGYAAGTIYDIADAPRTARAYNRAHSYTVTPTVMRTPSGNTTMGVGIGGTFE
jgi:hypothetical protein